MLFNVKYIGIILYKDIKIILRLRQFLVNKFFHSLIEISIFSPCLARITENREELCTDQ